MVVGSGRGRDLPAIVDKLVERASAPKKTGRSPRSARAVALTPDQETVCAAALANATGKQVNLKVDRRPVACSAVSSPPSATPSSTAPSAPVSTS